MWVLRCIFFFFLVLGWELLHVTLPPLKVRLGATTCQGRHIPIMMMLLWPPTGFSKIWQSQRFLLLSSQMESGCAWDHILFYCTVQNSNNFDGQITLFESGRVCRMWHLYDRHTHIHRQPYFQQVQQLIPWSSKSFSMGSHLIRAGLTDFTPPSAWYWRVCVWWLAGLEGRQERTSRQWHRRVYRVVPFRAELKAIALYPRFKFLLSKWPKTDVRTSTV